MVRCTGTRLVRSGEDDLDRNVAGYGLVAPKLIGLGGEGKTVEQEVLVQTQGDRGAAQAPVSGDIGVEIATIFLAVGNEEVPRGGAFGRQYELRRNAQSEVIQSNPVLRLLEGGKLIGSRHGL